MHTDTLKDLRDEPLLHEDELERLRLMALQYRSRRAGAARGGPGTRPGRARGQGMDLLDNRPYQPGDDIRHMDWRATARSGKPVTKVFLEERAHGVRLLIDRRATMMFGTRRELKAATAARVAAMLAFQALAAHESVGGLVLGDEAAHFPLRNTLAGALPLLRSAAAAPHHPGGRTPLSSRASPATIGELLGSHTGEATILYLVSDFQDVIEGRATLQDYLPRGPAVVVAVRVVDEAEQRMKDAGLLRLAPPGGGAAVLVDTRDPEIRRRYHMQVARRAAALQAQCDLHRVTLHTVTNYQDLAPQIEPLLR